MKASLFRLFLATALLAVLTARGMGAVTVKSSIDPPQIEVGGEVSVTYTVSGGDVQDFQLPPIDGLTPEGSSTSAQFVMSGFSVTQSFSHTFLLVPNHAGNIIIPAVDLHTPDGKVVRTQAMTLHVVGAAGAPSAQTPQNVSPSSPDDSGGGPVVMPPGGDDGSQQPGTVPDGSTSVSVPTDPDGQPARVFDVITPQTTTAYVGQSVPLRIESFIRVDAQAQQDSLPTLIGSDFLMNNLSLRPAEQYVNVGDIEYARDTWLTAISAPKAGDFPLQATRDTYWSKSGPPVPNDPFGSLFGRPAQLMHKDILSNKLVMHILPLPDQGRPSNFTGAIGKFQVSGNAVPANVGVGEPVTLRFTITGEGNFDYVHAPALAPSPAWKAYNPTSKTTFQDPDGSQMQAMKIFEQAIIPRKNGVLPLPAASFSYFDPDTKQYVTVPVELPSVSVTGEMPATASAETSSTGSDVSSPATTSAAPAAAGFAPNRLTFGSLTADLAPAYRHAGFWIVQGVLAALIVAGVALSVLRPRNDPSLDERALRLTSLKREEDAMDQAARAGDAVKFFTAARRATQLRLAERWQAAPESLTLAEIERRDPALAETVAPLFHEADDVNYSGAARSGIDLNEWNRRAREMMQPASL